MGRPPSNGGPSFRFNAAEVGEMEAILLAHNCAVPAREIIEALAQRFSATAERAGKVEVSFKQVLNWFQNRRYAIRAKAAKTPVPGETNASPMPRNDQTTVLNVPQAPQPQPQLIPTTMKSVPLVPHTLPAPSGAAQTATKETPTMEFEAKSARDGAWYDVTYFLSYRSLETRDPEALVRFAGFGPEEDEWVNIRRHVRQRSLPCESSECVAVLPGDLALCFQEGKEQALYFDAHVLDAQRRRHDVRGCRCRFLVRYDHDEAEEIVPLRKICRRPDTDYRMQQLNATSNDVNAQKAGTGLKVDDATDETTQSESKPEEGRVDFGSVTLANVSIPPPEMKSEILLNS
ncbi:protein sawadee homeodomain homolog 2 [Phtheirospermum japonicum]|uniref:Protein sawadee homeodomain homolog 2 n=1 Tax=Phtheirospermum japonicum TaxID=374723 RepID=A0A830B2B4_9LAMI|nr:protein sawadee homeodomain homolog 2 [Phtheirospermum japonicum]